jgi:hypothetical protein
MRLTILPGVSFAAAKRNPREEKKSLSIETALAEPLKSATIPIGCFPM